MGTEKENREYRLLHSNFWEGVSLGDRLALKSVELDIRL